LSHRPCAAVSGHGDDGSLGPLVRGIRPAPGWPSSWTTGPRAARSGRCGG